MILTGEVGPNPMIFCADTLTTIGSLDSNKNGAVLKDANGISHSVFVVIAVLIPSQSV